MKPKFKYRANSFFKENTMYLFLRNDGRVFDSEVEFYNGNWYTKESLQFKATSLQSVEGTLIGRECIHKITGRLGKITNKLKGKRGSFKDQFGVYWYNPPTPQFSLSNGLYKIPDLPPYWNDKTDILIYL